MGTHSKARTVSCSPLCGFASPWPASTFREWCLYLLAPPTSPCGPQLSLAAHCRPFTQAAGWKGRAGPATGRKAQMVCGDLAQRLKILKWNSKDTISPLRFPLELNGDLGSCSFTNTAATWNLNSQRCGRSRCAGNADVGQFEPAGWAPS